MGGKGRKKAFKPEEIREVMELFEQGYMPEEIAEMLDKDAEAIRAVIKSEIEKREEIEKKEKKKRGRKKKEDETKEKEEEAIDEKVLEEMSQLDKLFEGFSPPKFFLSIVNKAMEENPFEVLEFEKDIEKAIKGKKTPQSAIAGIINLLATNELKATISIGYFVRTAFGELARKRGLPLWLYITKAIGYYEFERPQMIARIEELEFRSKVFRALTFALAEKVREYGSVKR